MTVTKRWPLALITVAACAMCFWRLGSDRLGLDEGNYALATRNLALGESRQWLTVTPFVGHTYFQKPPLYMWLSAPLVRIAPESLWTYRTWSAVFGVATVVGTMLLGTRLAGRTVGALSGAILLTNGDFLFHHGARDGTMDTAVTFLTVVGVFLTTGRQRSIFRWLGIGACCGVMCLFKTFAGVPILALLACAGLLVDRDVKPLRRLGLVAVATSGMLVVGGWWYVACYARYGQPFLDEIVGRNVVERIAEGALGNAQGSFFYLGAIVSSSPLFALAVPAIAYATWLARRDRRVVPLTMIGLGMPVLFSLSVAKVSHYVFPAYPCLSVAVAVLVVDAVRYGLTRMRREAALTPVVGTFAVVIAVAQAVALDRRVTRERQYRPWEMFLSVRRDNGGVEFVGFQDDPVEWATSLGIQADDIFWLTWMRRFRATRSSPTLTIVVRATSGPERITDLLRGVTGSDRWDVAKEPVVAVMRRSPD
jgi:4-amino-4-deoxy-L-arabinose transferase-like glycosyltransferase